MAVSKRAGKKSLQQNDFLQPSAPINVIGTDVGLNRAYNDGAVSVSFDLPSGSAAATSYTVTASDGKTATGSSSPIVITGFATGATPTFTVTATNDKGTSASSSSSSSVTVTTVPSSPTFISASDVGTNRAFNDGAITINFNASASNGGKSITAYVATIGGGVGGQSNTGASSPITVGGIGSNASVYISVIARNANGDSTANTTSGMITVTTVPGAPYGVSASSPSAGTDNLSWSAPNDGGKAISIYNWTSSDGKSGSTASTSTSIAQEMGTAQTYSVTATNANGTSAAGTSNSVTTNFAFSPFGFTPFGFTPFGFTPFGFTPFGFTPFGFTPFGFTPFGFAPYGNFAFTPFSFVPFGFTPVYSNFAFTPFAFAPFAFTPFSFVPFGFTPVYSNFAFTPFGFIPYGNFSFTPVAAFGFVCVGENSEILTISDTGETTLTLAKDLKVGDSVVSPIWDNYDSKADIENSRIEYEWLENLSVKNGTVREIVKNQSDKIIFINNDKKKSYTPSHPILAKVADQNFAWEQVSNLSVGDIFMEYDKDSNGYRSTEILTIDTEIATQDVYLISVDDTDTFIASGIVCHK
jgi:hypothetical protein